MIHVSTKMERQTRLVLEEKSVVIGIIKRKKHIQISFDPNTTNNLDIGRVSGERVAFVVRSTSSIQSR